MPRYIVQRTFREGLHAFTDGGAATCQSVVELDAEEGVLRSAGGFATAGSSPDVRGLGRMRGFVA
jgi:hypothetical protein